MKQRPIYLDNHATTPIDPRVFEAMRPFFTEYFGNAASGHYSFGWEAEGGVKKGRAQVADLIGALPEEIYFTSGVTESNNWALRGVAEQYRDKGDHIITSVIEHKSILNTCHYLEKRGYRVTYLPVDRYGVINLEALEQALDDRTILVSVMAASNEIGTLAPLGKIAELTRQKGALFHTDAAQAVGKIPLDMKKIGIDLMSISAHKMYGPKGIGALYIRRRKPRVKLVPLLYGGEQERGERPGTLNVPAIVGLGEACALADVEGEGRRIGALRERLYKGLKGGLDNVTLNGHPTERLSGNLNLSFAGVRSDTLMMEVKGIAVSSGSACASGRAEPSYVLRAMGLSEGLAGASIRFGLGRFTTEEEIDITIREFVTAVKRLKT